jgi:uncharacterized protein YkwD
MSNPTAQEQEFLELINRMRLTPSAELELLLNSRDPTIKASIDRALTTFSTNLATLRSQWVDLQSVAPVAWSSELNNAAAAHNQEMIRTNSQTHRTAAEKKLVDRLTDAGYVSNSRAENVYAYAQSVFYAQAAFAIDWGDINSIDGIQSNAGHRMVLLSPDVREVGVAVTAENNPNTRVGPLVVTQDFASRDELTGKAYILGVTFVDKNRSTWYEAGEGIKDIQVKITGVNGTSFSDTFAVTDTGGYQKLLDPGRYQVDFIRNGNVMGRRIASIESTTPNNVKLDLVLPVVQLGSLQNAATGNNTLDFRTDTDLNGIKTNLNGKKIDISFTNVSADAAYHNYAGIYRVEDSAGTVINPLNGNAYKPGDTGYIEAALRRSLVANNGQAQLDNQNTNSNPQFKLDGGYQYATFVVADGSINGVLNASDPSKAPRVYFNYVAANTDGKQHFQSVGNNAFAVEDTFNLTDTDYNDLIFQVNAKVS